MSGIRGSIIPDQIDQLDQAHSVNLNNCDRKLSPEVVDYQRRVENVLIWLFDKESQLKRRPDSSALAEMPFNETLEEYSNHEKFIAEFYNYGSVVMKCKEDGMDLIDNIPLSEENRDEVGIQTDTMMVCYEKLKILSVDRLNLLRSILEQRQQSKIERFQEWLSTVEKRMSFLNNIGPDGKAIERQILEVQNIRAELEQKQEFLEFMSSFIVFDEVDTNSLQIRSKSSDSLDQDMDRVNRRWEHICKFINARYLKLQLARSIWDILQREEPQLTSWLKRVEKTLGELSEAASSITDPESEKKFIAKLLSRSEKLESEIKTKQTFYSSLEHRVREKIEAIDDSCSMLVIKLVEALEGIQESWNSLMNNKRMLDYKLHNLMKLENRDNCNMIPIIDRMTPPLEDSNNAFQNMRANTNQFNGDDLNDSVSNEDRSSSPLLNSSLTDSRPLESLSSHDKSCLFDNKRGESLLNQDLETQNDVSTESLTSSFPLNLTSPIADLDFSFLPHNRNITQNNNLPSCLTNTLSDNGIQVNGCESHRGCRVEEWKHSLESFSFWLKKVETALGLDEGVLSEDPSIRSWSQLDLSQQLMTLIDIERQITTTSQDEYDCLILQGQQIIADLIPELGQNEYETNLKEILADTEMRYGALKRCLEERKMDLSNRDRWLDLIKRLKTTSRQLIDSMSHVIPKTDIGIDLITLAQQQDQLIRSKTDLNHSISIQSNIQEAKMILRLCDAIQQQHQHQQTSPTVVEVSSNQDGDVSRSIIDQVWFSLKDLRGEIESQLDKITLHYTELSQLLDDRLERLDEVHKEVHALQQSMQELAAQLQVAEILKSKWEPLDNLSIEQLSEQLDDLKLYRERMTEIASIHDAMNSIFEWMTESDVPLNQQNLKRISELNTIWSLVQASSEERQRQIELAFDNQSASEQRFLEQSVADLPNWERRVAASKVPYFVDHSMNKTKWDHPRFSDLLNSMNSVGQVVFSAYRTALKLRLVQKRFGIDLLMLEHLKEILSLPEFTAINAPENQGIDNSTRSIVKKSNINSSSVDVEQVIHLLRAIYEKIKQEEKPDLDVTLAIDLTLNWLLNLYDS